jgi:hypothetical protein
MASPVDATIRPVDGAIRLRASPTQTGSSARYGRPHWAPPHRAYGPGYNFRVGLNAVPGAGFRPRPDPELRRRTGRRFYGRIGLDSPWRTRLLGIVVVTRFLSDVAPG